MTDRSMSLMFEATGLNHRVSAPAFEVIGHLKTPDLAQFGRAHARPGQNAARLHPDRR
jgi:hypothetical protein